MTYALLSVQLNKKKETQIHFYEDFKTHTHVRRTHRTEKLCIKFFSRHIISNRIQDVFKTFLYTYPHTLYAHKIILKIPNNMVYKFFTLRRPNYVRIYNRLVNIG